MPLKIYALVPSERLKECDHFSGFSYTGTIPCTGPRVCHLCGTDERDVSGPKIGLSVDNRSTITTL
jgi:hypothetical protein